MNSKEKILLNKGMDKIKREKPEEALEYFDKILEANPQNSDAWNNKGVALFYLGRVEEALKAYDKAMALNPQDLEALRNKGFVLRALGKLDDALAVYQPLAASGGDPLDMEAEATVLVGLGRLEEALDVMMKAVAINRNEHFEEEIGAIKAAIEQKTGGKD